MSKVSNRVAICDALIEQAEKDPKIVALVSDSRGSASLTPFAKAYPERLIEVGIAEQNLVGMAGGMASYGMKPYVASPASFLTMRAVEQIKVDVCYSKTNVKLIGISAGISYGALGMSHHSLQDIAVLSTIPNMRIFVPADHYEATKIMEKLIQDELPAYIRVGRNPVEEVHENAGFDFEIGKGMELHPGNDLTIMAIGEMVKPALDAARELESAGLGIRVLNFPTIKPLDEEIIIKAARETKGIITMEEHSTINGFGSMVARVVSEHAPCRVKVLGLPDESLITGESPELFHYYGLDAEGLKEAVRQFPG